MRVVFTAPARATIASIETELGKDDPAGALALVEQIEDDALSLAGKWKLYPVVRRLRSGDIRKKNSPPYLILYRVVSGGVQILRIAHERSDWVGVVAGF